MRLTSAEEENAAEGKVIPFPHSFPPVLFEEVMHVFEASCLVVLHAGAGMSMQAVLSKNTRGVAIVESKEQKAFVLQNPIAYAKANRLAQTWEGAPQKQQELIDYEEAHAKEIAAGKPKPAETPKPGPEPGAPEPPKPTPPVGSPPPAPSPPPSLCGMGSSLL